MSGSRDPGPDSVRGRLEFPGWYRTFSKSYLAWANAPGDLKTPLLLQGPALATAESWLLAAPDKLSESQKRFIVRSIAQRAKGGEGTPGAVGGKRKKWQWRRPSDRNLWQLYVVIGVGLWFFSPNIVRDLMERSLNPPKVYEQIKEERRGPIASAPAARETRAQEVADVDAAAEPAPADGAPQQSSALAQQAEAQPTADLRAIEPAAEPAPPSPQPAPANSRAVQLASLAQEQLAKGDSRAAILVGIEAMDAALENDQSDSATRDRLVLMLERAMTTKDRLGSLALRSMAATSTMLCRDGRTVLAITSDHDITAWRQGSSRPAGQFKIAATSFQGFGLDRDCNRLLAPNEDFNIEVRNLEQGRRTVVLTGHEATILAASFSRDGNSIVTASQDGTARIWDARSGRQRHLLSAHDWHVVWAEFSPDGRRVVTASSDMTARIWDAETGRPVHLLKGHQGVLLSARFVSGGRRILTVSWDGTARLWDAMSGQELHAFSQPGGINTAATNASGDRVLTSDAGGGIQIWDASTGNQLASSAADRDAVKVFSFAMNDRSIAVLRWSGKLEVLDAASLKTTATLSEENAPVRDMRVVESGSNVIAVTEDGQRLTWPLTGSAAAALAMARAVAPPCFSSDERATLSLEGEAPAWCAEVRRRGASLR